MSEQRSWNQIRLLLKVLSEETLVAPTTEFPFRISKQKPGYSDDREISALQVKLSIMLERAVEV
jgi:hypothetical protein